MELNNVAVEYMRSGIFAEAKERLVEATLSLAQFLQAPDQQDETTVIRGSTGDSTHLIIEKVDLYQESSDLRDKNDSGHFALCECAFRIRFVDLGPNVGRVSEDVLASHVLCIVMYNLAFLHHFTALLRGCLGGLDVALHLYELSLVAVTGSTTGEETTAANAVALVVGLNNMGHIHSLRFDWSQIQATVLRLAHLADSFCTLDEYSLRTATQLMCCYAGVEVHAPSA
jgi:hypothetical protein